MKKRLFASILAVALLLGLVSPVSTQATGTAGETVKTVTPNADGKQTFTDKTADPNASYEYIITGNDGSREAFTVGPKPMENTGNAVVGSASGVQYKKVTSVNDITDGNYLIIGAHTGHNDGWAIIPSDVNTVVKWNKDSAELNNRKQDPITKAYSNLEWEIKKNGAWYTIKKPNVEAYMEIRNGNTDRNAVYMKNTRTNMKIVAGAHTGSVGISQEGVNGYINNRKHQDFVGTYTHNDGGSALYLYKKYDDMTLDLRGLKALIQQAGLYRQGTGATTRYTADSWAAFEAVKAEAQTFAGKQYSFTKQEDANLALKKADDVYTRLWNAILDLTPNVKKIDGIVQAGEKAVPSIIWQRTLEFANDSNGGLVVDMPHIDSENAEQGQTTIKWDWSQISSLKTDPTMSVWDYNTENQYTQRKQDQLTNVIAATWRKGTSDWRKSTVRKFSGEFKWPAGYDLEDTAEFVSVNDANYQFIYDYIEQQKTNNPSLYERYKGAKVMPINDDMYVVMYKENDAPTASDRKTLMDRMVFWSGTSGKGLWSDAGITSDDWGHTIPAKFDTQNAIPAYHAHYPNMKHLNQNVTIQPLTAEMNKKLDHTDKWYTMANTSAVMSTLNRVYNNNSIQAGDKMRIDIYCFNNSDTGGMDQLELEFIKRQETSAKVQVNYFLDTVSKDTWLDSTQQSDVEVGRKITLLPGTGIHNLNYRKEMAKQKAGAEFTVSDGVQQVVPYVVVGGRINHINVVYKRETRKSTTYTYDFGVKNEYEHTLQEQSIQSVQLTTSKPNDLKVELIPNSNKCKITYKPDSALREQVMGILNVTYGNGQTYKETVYIYPASNVLYEEEFLKPDAVTKWKFAGDTPVAGNVKDNKGTVYGFTKTYNKANPENKTYEATVYPAKDPATGMVDKTRVRTGFIKTQFGGTGFDLIGTCGPTTGTLAVRVSNRLGEIVKAYVIDTKYVDTRFETTGMIQHVPLLHCEGLPNGTYDVTIQGTYINYGSRGGANTMSMTDNTQSDRTENGSDPVSEIYDLLYDMGLKEADIDNVEFVSVEDNMEAATYAVDGADKAATPTTSVAPESMTLGLDGFRVYGTTDNAEYAADKEQYLIYKNVLDSVNGNITAYLEKSTATTPQAGYDKVEYQKNGGPQYEVYLDETHSLALKADVPNAICQVALRSVTGKPINVSVNGQSINVTSPVEMYYNVTPENGIITIRINKTEPSNNPLLAVGNLKLKAGANLVALAEADYPVVYSLLDREVVEAEKVFEPEQFDVKMDSKKVGRKTKVTITVESSKDVEYITVNGKKVKAENDTTTIKGFFQNLFDKLTGKVENPNVRKFVFTKRYTAKQLNGLKHEIISYNKDRLASKPVIAEEVSK